jgi:hypothetical protein
MASGLSVLVLTITAGKFKIADSSDKVFRYQIMLQMHFFEDLHNQKIQVVL